MGGMWIWWLLAIAVIGLVAWLLVRSGRSPQAGGESPEDVLKRRLASGEIDQEEYRRTLEDLRR